MTSTSLIPLANERDVALLCLSQKAYCQSILACGRSYLLGKRLEKLQDEEGYLVSLSKLFFRDESAIKIVNNRELNIKSDPLSYKQLHKGAYNQSCGLGILNGHSGLVFPDLLDFMNFVSSTDYFQSLPVKSLEYLINLSGFTRDCDFCFRMMLIFLLHLQMALIWCCFCLSKPFCSPPPSLCFRSAQST